MNLANDIIQKKEEAARAEELLRIQRIEGSIEDISEIANLNHERANNATVSLEEHVATMEKLKDFVRGVRAVLGDALHHHTPNWVFVQLEVHGHGLLVEQRHA
jgi:2-iminoacetate synthase ThiH